MLLRVQAPDEQYLATVQHGSLLAQISVLQSFILVCITLQGENTMSKNQAYLVVIAGPNGAGKTTFYNKILCSDPLFKNIDFINLDNYAKELADNTGGNPEDCFVNAGRMVKDNIRNHFDSHKSFVYETTASGQTHLKIMEEAKNRGYKIATIFIGLSKVELSHLRVQKRVQEGGHFVEPEDIERRYPRVIKNFPEMLSRSDLAAVFDNSGNEPYRLIFLMDKYHFRIFYKYPRWVNEAIKDRKTSKNFIFLNANKLKKQNKMEQLKQITDKLFNKSK